jgi:hypothetical protein
MNKGEIRMRKVLLLAALLALVPATASHAADAPTDGGVISDHLATASTPDEVWENGSRGSAFVRIGWPVHDLSLHLHWLGTLYDDAGNLLSQEYDIHWESDPTLPTAVEKFELRGLKKARLRWASTNACLEYPDCDHTVVIDVRWKGYGPVTTYDGRDPITGDGYVLSTRAARVKGEWTVDGMTVPGGDFDLGTGDLLQERCFGPDWAC